MTLQDLLSQAVNQGAYEILIAPEAKPRIRKKSTWQVMSERVLTAHETRKLLMGFLNDEEKKTLSDIGSVEGFWSVSGQKFSYQIQISTAGVVGTLMWCPQQMMSFSFWNCPKWTLESLMRGRGLHLLIAKNRLDLEACATAFLSQINASSQKFVVWRKSQALTTLQSDQSIISYVQSSAVPEACDIYVSEGFEHCEIAMAQAEMGRSVLLLIQAHELAGALEEIARRVSAQRLAQGLKWALCLKVLDGTDGLAPAYDLLAGALEPVREIIRHGHIHRLEALMSESPSEPTAFEGVRTMNQSLLQLMLKRKIDLKQGFEESPAPEKLDRLLKKVGL